VENVEDNTYNLGEQWLEKELQHVNFCDKRLFNRLLKTTSLIEGKASGSINQSCGTWKDAKGAYRLFSNEKCIANEIYDSHHKETGARIKGNKFIFAIQDTTYLDFDSHIKTTGLGSVSKAYKKHKMGLIIHSTLAVTAEGLPLGLSSQQCWSRPLREEEAQEKSRRIYRTYISNKESYKWITALKETVKNVPEGTQIITLGDREADIFEFLWTAQSLDTFFVVRNRQDRKFICSEVGKTKLQTRFKQLPVKAEIVLQIPKRAHHETRESNIAIKYMTGFIPIRTPTLYGPKGTKHKINDKVAVYVVSAKEIDPPKGVEAIDWTLLTNLPVNSVEDAIERVNWYKLRWKVEICQSYCLRKSQIVINLPYLPANDISIVWVDSSMIAA
jgi:hypothetical protein